jgi:hypothetical protein
VTLSLWLSVAHAGTLDAEVALDALHASSNSQEPSSGPQPGLSATELGMRVRGTVEQGPWLAALDYQGREPLPGEFPNTALRTFYRLEGVLSSPEKRLQLGVGRFVAPSVVFLPVDGARVVLQGEVVRFEAFGGRRGVSTSLRGLSPTTLLPAAGGALSFAATRGQLDLRAAVAGDQVTLGSDPSFTDNVLGWNGQLRGHVRFDPLLVGAAVTAAPQVSYTLVDGGADPTLELSAFDLFQALAWTSWRPGDAVRVDADVLRQSASVVAGPVQADPPGEVLLVDPTFTDLRLRAALRPLEGGSVELGWLRPDARLRLRDGRTELRYGAGLELDDLGLDGPIVRGLLLVDDILQPGPAADDLGATDRLLWSASGGWSKGPLDLEVGASFVDRALAPVSARGLAATTSDDLAPFVLQAQNVVFGRGFLAQRRWFCGGDLEVSVQSQAPEIRAFLQVGLLGEADF